MIDLDKVAAGLTRCVGFENCMGCPYVDFGTGKCRERLMQDAREYLRED